MISGVARAQIQPGREVRLVTTKVRTEALGIMYLEHRETLPSHLCYVTCHPRHVYPVYAT